MVSGPRTRAQGHQRFYPRARGTLLNGVSLRYGVPMRPILIDANIYLQLYAQNSPLRELPPPLGEMRQHIFVTVQVVDEVERNKLAHAIAFHKQHLVKFGFATIQSPNVLVESDCKIRSSL